MRTILWYLPPDGQFEEQEVTLEEIEEAGFVGLTDYWKQRAGEHYPKQTLERFYEEVAQKSAAMKGEVTGADTYMKLVRIAQDVTTMYFPRRTGSYQYSLVLLGPIRGEAITIVCRDYPPL